MKIPIRIQSEHLEIDHPLCVYLMFIYIYINTYIFYYIVQFSHSFCSTMPRICGIVMTSEDVKSDISGR